MASVSLGDARELRAADGSADAVLLLGPLYHLTSRADRVTALREARRVLRPGGVVVAKALSRFYPVFEELAGGMPPEPGWRDSLPRFLADGQYRNPGGDPASLHDLVLPPSRGAHWPRSRTPGWRCASSSRSAGTSSSFLASPSAWMSRKSRDHVLSVLRLVEAEPSLIGMSQNFVAIAALPAGDR